MNRFFLFTIVLFFFQYSFSQEEKEIKKIDSLYSLVIENEVKIIFFKDYLRNTNILGKNLSYAYHKMGIIYSRDKRNNKAIEFTEKSIEIRKKSDSIDYYKLSNSLYNLNYYYGIEGEDEKKLSSIKELINLPVKNKFTYKTYIDLSYLLSNKGDYFKALDYLNEVIVSYDLYKDIYTYLSAHRAAIYMYSKIDETKRNLKRIEYHQRKVDSILNTYKLKNDPAVSNNLGNIYEDYGLKNQAVIQYNKALSVYIENKDSVNIGGLKNNLGRIHNKLNKRKEAAIYFEEALKITNDKKVIAAIYSNKGDLLDPLGKISYNKKAIGILLDKNYGDRLPSFEEIKTTGFKLDILDYLIENVEAGVKSYEIGKRNDILNKAIETSVLVDKLISFIRLESLVDTSKLFWIRKAAAFYMEGVTLSFYKKDASQAFYFMEKNKALLLLEELSKDGTNDKKEPFIISLEESINEHVDKGRNLLEYILNEKNGYGIFCSKEEITFFKLNNVPQLINEVDTLKSKMRKHFIFKKDKENYKKLANNVFKKLFPFKNSKEKIKNKELIIIPDYKLNQINFEALVTTSSTGEYLLQNTETKYLLSASVFEKLKKTHEKTKNKILAFAPVDFKDNSLRSLKRSEKAMQQIASIYATDLFLGEKARKETFVNEIKKYAIIHLNTHAGTDKIENKPWISFREKKVSLIELLSLSNNAELVILDACNGASGKQEVGEGIMSLSRGFFRGGARSVITTQWKANEKSTNEIFKIFYKELKKGKTKSKALHTAKKIYINTHQLSEISPYYWASLILIGSSDSVKITSSINYRWILFSFLLIIGAFFFIKRK